MQKLVLSCVKGQGKISCDGKDGGEQGYGHFAGNLEKYWCFLKNCLHEEMS